jgi:hypothetical protein
VDYRKVTYHFFKKKRKRKEAAAGDRVQMSENTNSPLL